MKFGGDIPVVTLVMDIQVPMMSKLPFECLFSHMYLAPYLTYALVSGLLVCSVSVLFSHSTLQWPVDNLCTVSPIMRLAYFFHQRLCVLNAGPGRASCAEAYSILLAVSWGL